ncbi:hypothetical protein BDFB_004777 [Asbolus verrucosus]|uniref:Uncharacterized protein n=1 Tax=Asbolus verrucosus TaxID=1661398 RepID=A0A482VL04_ASBVE|nr:hypothetical protein BDFB_004777 [Asbolus verrucosus]
MESAVVHYQLKIKRLLEKFFGSECQTNSDIDNYLDKLLVYLSPQEKAELEATLITLPVFTEWITRAVAIWSTNGTTPATNIATFTLNLASLLSKNEDRFCSLNNNNFFIKLVNVLKARQPEAAPSVKLAYIKLLSSFLEHKSGIEWMIACSFWEDILRFSLTPEKADISRESHTLMSKILEQTIDHDENFCNNVVKRIMLPLGETIYKSIKAFTEQIAVTNETMSQSLSSTLQLIGNILEYFLEGILLDQKDFRVALIFLKNFHLEERISDFMLIAQNKCLVFDLGKIMFIMQFLELYVNVVSNNFSEADIKNSVHKMINFFVVNISKGKFENFLKFCNFGHLYWNLIGSKILHHQVGNDNEAIYFANQLIVLKVMPNFCLIVKYCFSLSDLEELLLIDELRDVFVQKIFKMLCQELIRVAYIWRDFLISQTNLFEIGRETLLYAMQSRKYYSKDKAVIVFQTLIYVLKDFTSAIIKSSEKLEIVTKEISYFSLLFEVLAIFIEEFTITWKDGFEAIDVLAVSFEFLSLPNWPVEIVVKVLKLINISIAKYMSPNLALLIDRTTDSTVDLLGTLLYSKLHDDESQVKETALEVICTMSCMSTSSK